MHHQVDGARATEDSVSPQHAGNGLPHQLLVALEARHHLTNPVRAAAAIQGAQRGLLRNDWRTYGNGILGLKKLFPECRRVCEVAYAPPHHTVRFGKAEGIEDKIALYARVSRVPLSFICKILIGIVD